MKGLSLLISSVLAGPATFAAGLVLDGPVFSATNVRIVWNAPTNRWPTNLWIYKVLPQKFSPEVTSKLMAIGPFTLKDRTHIEGQPPFKDKRLLYFANTERTRHLGIFPPLGWIYYRDEHVNLLGKESARGVRPEAEVLELAHKWLEKFGIDRDELATRENSSDLQTYRIVDTRTFFDRTKNERKSEVILRGVSFVRRIDGVSLTGSGSDGGFTISFGNEGKIVNLELLWRNLKRERLCKAASPAEIMKRLEQGHGRMVPIMGTDLRGAKRLVIEKVTPFYLGEAGETAQDFVYPFAALECTLDGGSNRIVLKCPIIRQ
jgi:hypothetical protein